MATGTGFTEKDSASHASDPGLSVPGGRLGRSAWNWLDERYGLAAMVGFVRHKQVPIGTHSMVWYYLGGVTMFFFLVQIATGLLLLMYYQAGESTSYESMRTIVTKVPFGWMVRSIHCWSAHLMIVALLCHMWSVFFLKAYRKPREITWYTGIGLFGIALGFGFSGYLLPWNELSYFATAVGTDSVKSVPLIGGWLLRVLRGGDEVSIRTLYRFYALHICALPIATFGIIGLHLLLVQKQGMAAPIPHAAKEKSPATRGMPFFPNFALRDILLWVIAINLLALLAVLLPWGPGIPGIEWELGLKADPMKPAYPGIKPEWYFLWMYQLLKEFPAHILGMEGPQACLALSSILMVVWMAIPLLDRKAARNEPSPIFTDFGVGIIYFLSFLMLKAWDVGVDAPHGVDPGAVPEMARTIGRTATLMTLGLGFAVTLLRALLWKHRWFWISVLPLLHALLHGYAGLSYLVAAAVSLALLVVVLFRLWWGSGAAATAVFVLVASVAVGGAEAAPASPPAGAPKPASVATGPIPIASGSGPEREAEAGGSLPENKWTSSFRALWAAKKNGSAVISALAQGHFRGLPGHAQVLFFRAVEKGLLSSPEQLNTLLELDTTDELAELLVTDNCVLCHTNPDQQSDETLFRKRDDPKDPFRHLDIREVAADLHLRRGLSCSGCHGGKPTDEEMSDAIYSRWPDSDSRKSDRSWIPGFCTERCHSQVGFMRRYNPILPVDQILKYRESKHGASMLGKKDPKPAQCISCHGRHGIRRPSSPQSLVHPLNVPETCGSCHANPAYMKGYKGDDGVTPLPTNQLDLYRNSVHGRALYEKRDLGAPVCNDCHGNHAAMPPAVASISQICRNCHVNNGELFDGSPHKLAFEKHNWPECETCHSSHDIRKPSDDMLGTGPKSVCKGCHEKYGKPICNETANHFHDQIVALDAGRAAALAEVKAAEEEGYDLADLHFDLEAAKDGLVETRSKIHSFNRTEFDKAAKRAINLVDGVRQTVAAVRQERGLRKVGLGVSTLVVTFFAVLLWLKIREIDRKTGFDPNKPREP